MRVNQQRQTITMKDAAQEIGIGIRELYELLRNENVIERTSTNHHIARDGYIRTGYFENEFFTFSPRGTGRTIPAYRVVCKANGLSLIKRLVDEHKNIEMEKKPIRTDDSKAGIQNNNAAHSGEIRTHSMGPQS